MYWCEGSAEEGRILPSFCIISRCEPVTMDRQKLKELVRQLKSVVEALESEVYSDVDSYRASVDLDKLPGFKNNYSICNDDDGTPD